MRAGCPARFAHTAVWDAREGEMIVVGGEWTKDKKFGFFDDVWSFTAKSQKWKELKPKGEDVMPARGYHGGAWDSRRGCAWIFGGCGEDFKSLDDLWSFDTDKKLWKKASWEGAGPQARINPVFDFVESTGKLILYSGTSGFKPISALRDLWMFDPETNTWEELRCDAPPRWQGAGAVDQKRGIFMVHGGFDSSSRVQNDTWTYDIAKQEWNEAGEGPAATDAHSMVWNSNVGVFVIFGGAQTGGIGRHEVSVFDPEAGWQVVNVKGKEPRGRTYHGAVWNGDANCMMIFGGTENQFNSPMQDNEVLRLDMKK